MIRLIFLFYLFAPYLLLSQTSWLVRYAQGQARSNVASFPNKGESAPLYPGSQWQRIHFEQSPDSAFLSRIKAHPSIAFFEREVRYSSQAQPNDPGFAEQWALQNTGQMGGPLGLDLRAMDAWDFTTGSQEVTVAVVDAGIDWRHPDLIDNIWQNLAEDADGDGAVLFWNGSQWEFDPDDINGMDDDGNGYADDFIGWDFVNNDNDPSDDHRFGHGTHVAGIIAARGNNGLGITGVSWHSQIMALKFLDANGSGLTGDAIAALRYARQMGADLSNNSWGGGLFSQALHDELLLAQQAGMICVAAAGNNFGNNNDVAPLYPASYDLDNIISVSATDPMDSLATFANRGLNSIDLCAPGYGIYSTLPGDRYGFLNGTSMATPFVTGALALLRSQQPALGVQEARQLLLRSVRPLTSLRNLCATEGRLDLLRLLQRPLLFQRSLPGNVLAGTSLSDGRLIAAGTYRDSLWVASLKSDGEVAWSLRQQAGKWRAVATDAHGGVWLGGQQGNGIPLFARLDSTGQSNWSRQLNWGNTAAITEMIEDSGSIWAAGWVLSGTDTASWLLKLDQNGIITQQHLYASVGRDLRPVALAASNEAEELSLLLQLDDTDLAWLRLDDRGTIMQADELDWPGTTAVMGHSIWSESDDWQMSGQLVLSTGERQLFVLEWEDDDGYEEVDIWPLGQPQTSSTSGAGRAGSRWLSSGAAGSQGPGMRLIYLDPNDENRVRRSYAWPGEAVNPVWVGQARAGLVSWLLQRPTGGSYWGQTDENGSSLCFVDSIPFNKQNGPLPITTSLNLSSPGIGASLSPINLIVSNSPGTSTLLCDNSQCSVKAFFSLPSLESCEGGDLIPTNLSQNASAYQWWLEGEVVDTMTAPLLEAPDDEGSYELLLVAFEGQCTDTFRLPLLVEPPLQQVSADTIHCGQRLTLQAADAATYSWRDENDNVIGEEAIYTFEQSGSYRLELSNVCGETVSSNYEIMLQGDCVWPGDISADGRVDMVDYLLLGLVHGQSGPVRANASPTYTPQTAPVWNSSFQANNPWAAGVNLAHADANGDGLVDAETDGALVRLHHGKTGLPRIAPNPTAMVNINLQLDTTVVRSGDSVGFQVSLTTANGQPIPEAYGLALTLEASIPLSRPIQVSPQGSWLTVGGANDTLVLREPGSRRVQVGLNRLDQIAAAPNVGLVMSGIIIVVIDDIGSYAALAERGFLTLAVSEALLVRPDGSSIALNPLGVQSTQTLQVLPNNNTSVGVEKAVQPKWVAFPNPTNGQIQLKSQVTTGQDRPWRLTNLYGQIIASGLWPGQEKQISIDLGMFSEGYYVLQVEEAGKLHHTKVWLRK